MPNIFGLRKGLYQPVWEGCSATPLGDIALFITGVDFSPADLSSPVASALLCTIGTGNQWMYYPQDDAYISVPNPGFNSLSGGTCFAWNPNGPTGTVSSATSLSITTNYTSVRNLAPYVLRLTGGTGAGQERTVSVNTIGANTVFTVTQPWTVTPDATTTWVLRSGRHYYLTNATIIAGNFKYYDVASYTSANLSVTGLPAQWAAPTLAGDGAMVAPNTRVFATGTATSGGAFTLTNAAKNWTLSWANFQVRITGGTGAGQVRTIASSTTTQLTVDTAWAITPDNTSTYEIGANEDHIYVVGSNLLTIFRYTISTNTWVTLSPSVARTTPACYGCTLAYIDQDPSPLWNDESACLNGRYLYSIAGGSGSTTPTSGFERFDITSLAWSNAPGSSTAQSFGFGTCWVYAFGKLYINNSGVPSFITYSPSSASFSPFSFWPSASNGSFFLSISGSKRMFASQYIENGVTIKRIYCGVCSRGAVFSIQVLE